MYFFFTPCQYNHGTGQYNHDTGSLLGAGASSWMVLYPLETLRSRVTTGAVAAPEGMKSLGSLLKAIVARCVFLGVLDIIFYQ